MAHTYQSLKAKFLLKFIWVFFAFSSNVAKAQILTFDFAGLLGSEVSASSNGNDINLASSSISRGSGLAAGGNADRFNATGWATTASIDLNDYFEFAITPNSGYQFSVSSVAVQLQRSGTGPRVIEIRSSVDGYASTLGSNTISDITTTQTFTFTFSQLNVTTATSYRIYMYNSEASTGTCGIGDGAGNDLIVNGSVTSTVITPTITVSPSSLTGLNYILGSGPSAEQTFTCSGSNLSDNITLTAPTNYEISTTSGSGFTNSITLTQASGIVASTTIYVRLKAGLSAGTYNEIIDLTSTGATSKTITCSGNVTVVITGVFINELLVNPSDANDGSNAPNTSEWVELFNSTGASVDISCWFITDGDFAVTFPAGSTIASGGYFTIASANGSGLSPDLDWALCGCTSGVASEVGIFTNSAEQVVLYDASGNLMDAVIWGGGQLPDGITRGATGSCSSVTVSFPGSGSFENIGSISDGVPNERETDGSSTWQPTTTGTFGSSNATVVLPIELIYFNGKFNGLNANDLFWTTASETNNDFFTLEKSTDGISFSDIARVDGAGNSTTILNYSFQDTDLKKEISYYRLKQTDLNGSTAYSKIISINSEKDYSLQIFPNPGQNELTVQFETTVESFAYEIISLQGVIVRNIKQNTSESSGYKIDIAELAAGTYILRSYSGKEATQTLFIKN